MILSQLSKKTLLALLICGSVLYSSPLLATAPPDCLYKVLNDLFEPASIDGFLNQHSSEKKRAWLRSRGARHVEKLKAYASEISKAYASLREQHIGLFRMSYERFGALDSRGKSYDSVLAKLLRKDFDAFEKGQMGIDSLDKSLAAIGDGIGIRLTFKADADGVIDPALIQGFVDQIVIEIKNGNQITKIENYRPSNGQDLAYLTDEQIQQIAKASAEAKFPGPIIVENGAGKSTSTGHTAFHMNIKYKNGAQAEFQAYGPKVDALSDFTHLFYDANSGKPLSPSYFSNPTVRKVIEDFQNLTPRKKAEMLDYIKQRVAHARKLEKGDLVASPPKLPLGLPESFSYENLAPHL